MVSAPGCSTAGSKYRKNILAHKIEEKTAPQSLPDVPALEDRVLSLNPEKITERDIREVMSRYPAPRIINLNGSLPIVTMDSFSRFLIAMGYPEERIRNPKNGDYSYSSYTSSKKLAGMIAWYYEKEGMMPMLIGHSQGGMVVVKVLHELNGSFNKKLPVWNPATEKSEDRFTIIDPITGVKRAVIGLKVGYSAAIGTGILMRFLLGQWDMLTRLWKIPDTVKEFTGYHIKYDLLGGGGEYYPLGTAVVSNVKLPAGYSHFRIPITEHLAGSTKTREWINNYAPAAEKPEITVGFEADSDNILFAADIWYSIKKHWCIELQQLIRAKRRMENIR